MDISGKAVVITGASRGLGVDIAREFAREGGRLALAARSHDELEKVRIDLEASGAEVVTIPTDVTDIASLENLIGAAKDALGPIDILVNNAAVEEVIDFERMSPEDIEWIVRVNVIGLTVLTRLVVPSMIERQSGHIVNIASMAGLLPVPHNSVYSATKHAVVGLSHSLRLELAEHGIGVSVICPGFVEGGMFAQWGRPAPRAAGSVTPEQVARATVDAVKRNRPEVKVNPPLGKLSKVVHAISPTASGRSMEMTGVLGFLKEQARLNAERNHGRSS